MGPLLMAPKKWVTPVQLWAPTYNWFSRAHFVEPLDVGRKRRQFARAPHFSLRFAFCSSQTRTVADPARARQSHARHSKPPCHLEGIHPKPHCVEARQIYDSQFSSSCRAHPRGNQPSGTGREICSLVDTTWIDVSTVQKLTQGV